MGILLFWKVLMAGPLPAEAGRGRPGIPCPATRLSQWDAPAGNGDNGGSDEAKTQAPSALPAVAVVWTGQGSGPE